MAQTAKASGRPLCPSARCKPGSLLLGIVQTAGDVRFLAEPMIVTEDFAAIARQGRTPEARFRFSSPCLRSGCDKWAAGCGVAARASEAARDIGDGDSHAGLPCAIRSRCQWFAEHGGSVCRSCRWIITERPSMQDNV
jgi:hypothetical protein